jgi:hypothetical protein
MKTMMMNKAQEFFLDNQDHDFTDALDRPAKRRSFLSEDKTVGLYYYIFGNFFFLLLLPPSTHSA